MSLIPYHSDDSRSVILRHQRTLVLYDPESRQIVLREASESSPPPAVLSTCPLCNRPFDSNHDPQPGQPGPGLNHHRSRSSSPLTGPGHGSDYADASFVDPGYFRMLESSIAPDDQESTTTEAPSRVPRLKPEDTADAQDDVDDHPRESTRTGNIDSAAFSPKYFERFFVAERELGRGGKGVVLLVQHVLDGVHLGRFACKRVPVGNDHEWLEKVLLEVQLLQRLSHQNLVSYRHVWLENMQLTNFGPSVPCAFILQQYCNSGDLQNYILSPAKQTTKEQLKDQLRRRSKGRVERPQNLHQPRRLPFDVIIKFFRDIASGLHYLHTNGFIHRDLKPSNCLLHDTGIPGQGLRVLVSDFGEVQIENTKRNSTGNTGTISYCAPEVLRRVSPAGEFGNFTAKSDIFSLGMILHFVCFGKLPYLESDQMNEENENLDSLRAEITAWQGFDETEQKRTDLPERLYQSLKTLISPDPSVRPSAEDILVGIEIGLGEESTPMRRGSSASQKAPVSEPLDDGQALGFRRISPVADTPPPGTPVDGSSSQLHKEYSTFGRNLNSSSRTARKGSRLSAGPTLPDGSPTPKTARQYSESSIILRPRMDPVKTPTITSAIIPVTWRQRVYGSISIVSSQWLLVLRLGVFLAKVVSLTHPCFPFAVNPWVFYFTLGLATLDFATPYVSLTILLGVMHVVLFLAVRFAGQLCSL